MKSLSFWSTSTWVLNSGSKPSWVLLGILGILMVTTRLSSSTPAHDSLLSLDNLENMSSAELEELANQLAAQEHQSSPIHNGHHSDASHNSASGNPESSPSASVDASSTSTDSESNSFHVLSDCVTVSMDEGAFHYKSRGTSDQVCGLYLTSDPDKSIIITLDYLDVGCQQGGLISVCCQYQNVRKLERWSRRFIVSAHRMQIALGGLRPPMIGTTFPAFSHFDIHNMYLCQIVDGWEMNGEVFPSVEDHEKSYMSRFQEFCGLGKRRLQQTFLSSQNAALIQYRIPVFGQGFSIRVQHVHNPRPCNILVQDTEGEYTLQNYGRNINCSLTTIFNAKIRTLHMSTGQHGSKVKYSHSGYQRGIYHKCGKMGLGDYVQIGGGSGLETSKMQVIDEVCGHISVPAKDYTTIFCEMTTIRLVSSGKYHNKITAEVRKADYDDIPLANFICGM